MIRKSLISGAVVTGLLLLLLTLSLYKILPANFSGVVWLLYPATTLWYVMSEPMSFYVPYSSASISPESSSMYRSAWFWVGLFQTFLLYSALSHWIILLLDSRAKKRKENR
jgi:hypothetical protein